MILLYNFMKDIKQALKSLTQFWFLNPIAIYDIYQESKHKKIKNATTKLDIYKQIYKSY